MSAAVAHILIDV